MLQQVSVIRRAIALESEGHREQALQLYRQAAEAHDTAPSARANAWFRAGVLQHDLGLMDEALQSWAKGAEAEGDPGGSRRCAFHAASALAAAGDRAMSAYWLRHASGLTASGEPSDRALQWKLVAVEPESAAVPSTAEGLLEALIAVEAGFAVEQTGDLTNAAHAYRLALDANVLDEASRANAEMRLRLMLERLALRAGEIADGVSVDALHLETWNALERNDLHAARRLALRMPPAKPETAARIGHMLITTAFRLETAGDTAAAQELYEQAVADEGLPVADRANAAFRLGLLLGAAGERERAETCLRHAIASPDDGVHAAAALHLAHHLIQDGDWLNARSICESERIADPDLGRLLAVRSLQCCVWLDELPVYPEEAAEKLPPPLVAHAGAWMDAALACESTNHYAVARVLYERLLGVAELPVDIRANVHFRLGLALDRLTLWTEAEPYLEEAANAPAAWPATRALARYRLAAIYYLGDRYELALNEYNKLRGDAGAEGALRADAQLKHAICLYRLSRVQEACRDFRTCRAIGGEIEVKAELMLAEIAEAGRDFAAARESYNRLLQHPQADPLTRSGALQRLRDLPRR